MLAYLTRRTMGIAFWFVSLYLLVLYIYIYLSFMINMYPFLPVLGKQKIKRFTFKYPKSICNCLVDTVWQWGRTKPLVHVCLPWLELEQCCWFISWRLRFECFPPPSPQRACLCALWELTALFLAFQKNELWILNDFLPSSLAALPRGVSAEIFNTFACHRLVTIHIWSVLKACGFLSLGAAAKSWSWAEIKQRQGSR